MASLFLALASEPVPSAELPEIITNDSTPATSSDPVPTTNIPESVSERIARLGASAIIIEVCLEDARAETDGTCWKRGKLAQDRDEPGPPGGSQDYIVVKFRRGDRPLSLEEAGFAGLALRGADGAQTDRQIGEDGIEKSHRYIRLPLRVIKSEPYLARQEISVAYSGGTYSGHFYHRKKVIGYGFGGKMTGVWMPVGLFSTSFQRTGSGIPFAAMPVGLAAGAKLYMRRNFYLGVSGICSWLIHPSVPTAEAGRQSRFNLAALSAGLLFDISNFAYVGYVYGLDFTKSGADPQSMFVIGAAPGLLDVLKGKNR